LRRQAARWAADNFEKLVDPDPDIPEVLNDRAADNWRPLLTIADLAGSRWPQRAREAACLLSGDGHESSSINVELLADIKAAFGDKEAMSSADLVAALVADPERPWAEWRRGRPLTQRQLARLLKPFCVIPQTVHIPGFKDAKGYIRIAFEEAWVAYLPGQDASSHQFRPSDPSKRPNLDGMGTSCNFRSVQAAAPDGSKNANLSYSHAGLDTWTDRKAGNGVKGHSGQEIASDPTDPGPIPEFLLRTPPRRCDHCGSMLGAMNPWDWPGRPDGIWLHPRCEAGWMNSWGRSRPAMSVIPAGLLP